MLQRTVAGFLTGLGLAALCAGGPEAARAGERAFTLKQPRTKSLKNLQSKFDSSKPLNQGQIRKFPVPGGGVLQPGKKPGSAIDPTFGNRGRGPITLPPGKLSPIVDKLPPLARPPVLDPAAMPKPQFAPPRRPFFPRPPLGPGVLEPKLPFDPTKPLLPRDPQFELPEGAVPPAPDDPPADEAPPADEPPAEEAPPGEEPPAEENPPVAPPIGGGWVFPVPIPWPGGRCAPNCPPGGYAAPIDGVAQPIDLELIEVRQLDRGDAVRDLGPAYRITLRNRSGEAVNQAFNVALVASLGREPAADSDVAAVRVEGMAAGQRTAVDVRLSTRALRLGLNADGQAVPFAWLIAVVDSHGEVEQLDRENDYGIWDRREIAMAAGPQ